MGSDRSHPRPRDDGRDREESAGRSSAGARRATDRSDRTALPDGGEQTLSYEEDPSAEVGGAGDLLGGGAELYDDTQWEKMAVTKSEADFLGEEGAETERTTRKKLIYFSLNDELFAATLDSISSVEELTGLTRFPGAPEPIDGATDLRGKILAVLDPKVVVNIGSETTLTYDEATTDGGADRDRREVDEEIEYIIVQEEREEEHRIGVRVDDISHVETVKESDITPISEVTEMDLVAIEEEYLGGMVHGYRGDDERQIPLLDLDAITDGLKEF